MRLVEIAQQQQGTYAAARLSDECAQRVVDFCKTHGIPNSVPKDKLHSTILYSRKHLPEFQAKGPLSPGYIGLPNGFDVWKSQSEDNPTSCLVMKIDSDDLQSRHMSLMDEHEGTWDFPDYTPHITLSYDIGDYDMSSIDVADLGELQFTVEYGEDLDLNWADNNT